ncbi:D-sedoheptulose-7-phosphate isomerase [Marinagarivorans algicola]|uniref:D-sedoheptulose-7-phosphate isomerase n=1 Tax=Marinagarivorans algicola TaxID=1513270 RepID=UPI0006B6444D|nr:SIS domain-containing protein [Marinagarivorans algicola]
MSLRHSYTASLARHRQLFATLDAHADALISVFEQCQAAVNAGGKILFFGNGGSAADSQHLAAELMVRYKAERAPIRAIALTTDTSILTAHSNDYSFDSVFERQILGLADSKDVVIGLSTSGNSPNVNLGLQAANTLGAYSIAFTGRDGGKAKDIAHLSLIIDCDETARIQEAHLFMGHWLCEAFDQAL